VPRISPSDLGVFVSAKRAAAANEAEDSSVVKGTAVAATKQAPSPPVGCMAVSMMAEHDDAALQVTAGERAVGVCL